MNHDALSLHPLVKRHAPWSLSKAGVLQKCARQFNFKYIIKEKETSKSAQSKVGTTAHAIQEFALNSLPTYEELEAHAIEKMGADQLTHSEKTEVAAKLHGVSDFVTRVSNMKRQYGVRRELVEYQMAVDECWNPVAFHDPRAILRGVLDYGLLTDSGVLLVVDHKSGRRKRITEHSEQFYIYMAMAIAHFSDVVGVQCAINYFGAEKLDWYPRLDQANGPWSRSEIEMQIIPWINRYLNTLAKRLPRLDANPPEPETGWQCEYCGFADRCDAGTAYVADKRAKRSGEPPTNV